MGNCVVTHTNNISPKDQITYKQERTAKTKPATRRITRAQSALDQIKQEGSGRKKVHVRFKLHEEQSRNDGDGVVRIKMVMTKEELKHILKHGKELKSVEKVVSELKMRNRKRIEDQGIIEGGSHQGGSWRPVLERIPE